MPTEKQIAAAKLSSEGIPQAEIARIVGYKHQETVSRALASVFAQQEYDDVLKCRALVDQRFERIRERLLEIAGIANHERPANMRKKSRGKHTDSAAVLACRALIDLERRRSAMFGWDAPRAQFAPAPPPSAFDEMTLEEIADECRARNIPVPPGLEDELAARASRQLNVGHGGDAPQVRDGPPS